MKIRLHYLAIILLIMANRSFADDFSGEWIWPDSDFLNSIQINVRDYNNGNNLSGQAKNRYGFIYINGGYNENSISLILKSNERKENCPLWVNLIASCQDTGCTTMHGIWYDSNHLMGDLTLIKNDKKFYISSPSPGSIFLIDTQSAMPQLSFTVHNPYSLTLFQWSLKVGFHWKRGRVNAKLPVVDTNTNDYEPDFSQWKIIGGNLNVTVKYNPSSLANKIATANYKIYGTNPGKSLIDLEINDPILSKIACVESGYRQFDAPRENGHGLPLIGVDEKGQKKGGIGIMQVIYKKYTSETLWDWRYNIKAGIDKLNDKRKKADRLYINERDRLNAERKKSGLPPCPSGIPYPLTADQLTRESIRRYNYGVEYRWEPRDGKNCSGKWVISPSCVRHSLDGCDPDYVNKVLQCSI
ncbi:MAG TPA: hypothetical protein VLJ15_08440 [Gammaproteobacteria bacterium]|nr:hypothetical protein [Gammaproteobacteria bacterium]